jgi:hypothetical protein
MIIKRLAAVVSSALLLVFAVPLSASAASTQTDVLPGVSANWTAASVGGANVSTVLDSTVTLGIGALRLTSDGTPDAQAQFSTTTAPLALNLLDGWHYSTRTVTGASASFNVSLDVNYDVNNTSDLTVNFDPVRNTPESLANGWQRWDLARGKYTSEINLDFPGVPQRFDDNGIRYYSFNDLLTIFGEPHMVGYGVQVGPNKPATDVQVDTIVSDIIDITTMTVNTTTINFEAPYTPEQRADCRDGNWVNFNTPTFTNAGKCTSFVAKTK